MEVVPLVCDGPPDSTCEALGDTRAWTNACVGSNRVVYKHRAVTRETRHRESSLEHTLRGARAAGAETRRRVEPQICSR